MRMDKESSIDAFHVINKYSEENLSNVLFDFGDLKNSKRISKEICIGRKEKEIKTTFQLNSILKPLFPSSYLNKKLTPKAADLMDDMDNEWNRIKKIRLIK